MKSKKKTKKSTAKKVMCKKHSRGCSNKSKDSKVKKIKDFLKKKGKLKPKKKNQKKSKKKK